MGEAWFRWLQQQRIPCHQRLRRNTLVSYAARKVRLDQLFGALKPGQGRALSDPHRVWGCSIHLSALRLQDGDFLFLARSNLSPGQALATYADRWQIETLFGCLKSRGFHLEETHLTHPERLSKRMGLLAFAFAWACRTGELLHDGAHPIRPKKP